MCFEKRHLHAALEGCDKYPVSKAIYPFHSKLASTRNWADGFTSINANDASMPRCQWISLWGRYATHSTKCSPSPSLSLSLPHQATPITDIDAKQRRRRKMKIEKQAAALVEQKKTKTTSTRKKNTTRKNTKRNTTTTATTENTQILICRHFSRY